MDWNINDVSYVRPELLAQLRSMRLVRDVVVGESAVKNGKERYLPRLPGHSTDDLGDESYKIYLDYAYFYPATARTASGLRGLVFRKDPVIMIPENLKKYEENITADGQSMVSFSKDVFFEVILTNRCGVFVDFPVTNVDESYSKADVEKMNIRPYVRLYKAETIVNWRTKVINNQTVTSMIVLKESIEQEDTGGFKSKIIPQYRVLYLDGDNMYTQDLYQYRDPDALLKIKGGYELIDHVVPLVNGKHLEYIPFYPITDKGITWELTNSTLLPLAETNLAHFRNSANRENALIWTGNPSPVFSGYAGNPDEGTIRIGSTEAILLQNGGSAQFLEFTGQGIDPIKEAMQEKEEAMSVLGARIISPEKRTAETAESAMIHRAGEQGVLSDIANSISDGLTKIFRFFGIYHDVKDIESITVELNTDFTPSMLTGDSIARLGEMYQHRLISWESYFWAMQRGEVMPPDSTAVTEYDKIVADKKRDNVIIEEDAAGAINRTATIGSQKAPVENIKDNKVKAEDVKSEKNVKKK